jgi:heterotetrameric sarcosine oxidase gamma subunit
VSESEPVFDGDPLLPLSLPGGLAVTRWHGPVAELTAPPGSVAALIKALDLPGPGRFDARPAATCMAFRPRTWLILGEIATAPRSIAAVMVDQSHGKLVFLLEGQSARALLMRGCRIDLRDASFPQGAATTTVIGQITVTLLCDHPGRSYRLVVGSSFAHALLSWIKRTARHLMPVDVQ